MASRELIEESTSFAVPETPERRLVVLRTVPPDEPVSPELALVDPELARVARALLPDVPLGFLPPSRAAASAASPGRERTSSPSRAPSPPPANRVAPAQGPFPLREVAAGAGQSTAATAGRGLAVTTSLGVALALLFLFGLAASPGVPTEVSLSPRPPVGEPAPPPANLPVPPVKAAKGRVFVWAPVAGAAAYEFQLFRGERRVYVGRAPQPRLVLPRTWRHRGVVERLRPGSYRWYVWPVPTAGGARSEAPIVQATLAVG